MSHPISDPTALVSDASPAEERAETASAPVSGTEASPAFPESMVFTTPQEEFIALFQTHIHRDGAEALLDYLVNKSDFFTSPASTQYHGNYAGGLCEHSVNVYHCLKAYLARTRVREVYGLNFSEETIALVSLLHDVCKIGTYRASTRNVKGPDGKWTQVPTYTFDDPLPYGHGEKSVYVIGGFLRLTRQEAMAIRWHMGFSGPEDARLVGKALEKYPLAFALSVADMEATYFLE